MKNLQKKKLKPTKINLSIRIGRATTIPVKVEVKVLNSSHYKFLKVLYPQAISLALLHLPLN